MDQDSFDVLKSLLSDRLDVAMLLPEIALMKYNPVTRTRNLMPGEPLFLKLEPCDVARVGPIPARRKGSGWTYR